MRQTHPDSTRAGGSAGHFRRGPTGRARRRRGPTALAAGLALTLIALLVNGCSGATSSASKDLTGHLTISGSTALYPLVSAAAKIFTQQHPKVQIETQASGSLAGLKAVSSGASDVGMSDVYADPATYSDPNLTDHIVAIIPFTMIVNPNITITSLTRQQIVDIFSTGKITNWKQVDPSLPDQQITVIVRPATSGTRATFRTYILNGGDERGQVLQSDTSQTVVSTVAKTPGAIGYLALSALDTTVRAVAMDGQQPTLENIQNGAYVFWGYEHMYTLGDTTTLLDTFLNDFMVSPQVQQLAQQLRYIPITDLKFTQPSGQSGGSTDAPARQAQREDRRHATI